MGARAARARAVLLAAHVALTAASAVGVDGHISSKRRPFCDTDPDPFHIQLQQPQQTGRAPAPAPPVPATSMLLCTFVVNETRSHLVEWIEFHRLQGFDHIHIVERDAGHIAALLGGFYPSLADAGVSVAHADAGSPSQTGGGGGGSSIAERAYADCAAYGEAHKYTWVAAHAVNEFWFSPLHYTTKEFGSYMADAFPQTTVVHIHQFRYGPKGTTKPVELPKLVVEELVWRSPSSTLGEGMAEEAIVHGPLRHVCNTCTEENLQQHADPLATKQKHCGAGAGHVFTAGGEKVPFHRSETCSYGGHEYKSMWRTGRGCIGGVHGPLKQQGTCSGEKTWADPNHLRGNHYFARSIEEGTALNHRAAVGGASSSNADGEADQRGRGALHNGATQFFEALYDGSALAWIPDLKVALTTLMAGAAKPPAGRTGGSAADLASASYYLGHAVSIGINRDELEEAGPKDDTNKRRMEHDVAARMRQLPERYTANEPMWWLAKTGG